MAPSKRRSALEHKLSLPHTHSGPCACLAKPRSDGLCDLNVWQGTTVDPDAAHSGERLLRPKLPIVKYKHWTLCGLSGGHLYHLVILSWPQLLALFTVSYILVVGLFALLFAGCNGIDYPNHHGEMRYYFNLSLQTLGTIGYGYLFPRDACSNWVAVVEAFVSMLLTAFMTGVAFVKFARPRPNIIFSKVFTVSERESGGLEMRFRVVNGTRREVASQGEILEVSFKLILMRVEDTNRGEKKLCYYDLHLKTSNFITLRLEAELVHHIDSNSPFFELSQSAIRRSDFVLVLMMAGVDENLHDMIHTQREYDHEAMRWGATFVPMLSWNPQHRCTDLDFAKPASVAQRRLRFRNHPMSRFSKGLYYRALETPWKRLFPWLVIMYFAVISVIALLLYISVLLQTSDELSVNEFERLFFFCAQTISTIGYGVRNVWPIVQLGTTVTHIIDEESPLYRCSTDELLSGRYFFVVLFAGLDSVIVENMFARKTYHSCDVLVGHHFVDNIMLAADGLHIDLEAINDTQLTPDVDLRESKLYAASESPRAEADGEAAVPNEGDGEPTLVIQSPIADYVELDEDKM
ncbi:hypothetical protein PybrP1_000122 [[Pythium] brassicae (nom. inval.)]|nr:hypothetical protein PybrP1_000122 [[Pythium] brassicae (nom. inval.)]